MGQGKGTAFEAEGIKAPIGVFEVEVSKPDRK